MNHKQVSYDIIQQDSLIGWSGRLLRGVGCHLWDLTSGTSGKSNGRSAAQDNWLFQFGQIEIDEIKK